MGEYSLDVIIGRNLNMFNSNLTHIIMVEFLLIAINNLVTKINLNTNKGLKIIILIRNYVFFPLLTVVCF